MLKEGINIGVFLIISLINILLWLGNRKRYSFLFLGLFSLFQAVNLIGRGETMDFLESVNNELYYKGQAVILSIKLILLNAFLVSIFDKKINKTIFSGLLIIVITLLSIYIFMPWRYLGNFLLIYHILILLVLLYYGFQSLFYLKNESRKAFVSLISMPILLISFILDFINYKYFISSISLISYGYNSAITYGFVFFTITYTYYLYISNKEKGTDNISIDKFAKKYGISGRECDVLRLLIKRYTYKEISKFLFVSTKTVDTHVYHIYQKTGVGSKEELLKLVDSIVN